jgi:hypothetical protein
VPGSRRAARAQQQSPKERSEAHKAPAKQPSFFGLAHFAPASVAAAGGRRRRSPPGALLRDNKLQARKNNNKKHAMPSSTRLLLSSNS